MRSRNGASGWRIGVSAKSSPSVAGVHLSIMIPWGTSMNESRFGRAVSGAAATHAGIIASSIGSARVAPAPRSTARREMAFLKTIIAHPPQLERRALDDVQNERGPAVVLRRGVARN